MEPDLLVVAVVTVLIRGSNRCGEFGCDVIPVACSQGIKGSHSINLTVGYTTLSV